MFSLNMARVYHRQSLDDLHLAWMQVSKKKKQRREYHYIYSEKYIYEYLRINHSFATNSMKTVCSYLTL